MRMRRPRSPGVAGMTGAAGCKFRLPRQISLFRSGGVVASAGGVFTRPNRHRIQLDVPGWSSADWAPHLRVVCGFHEDMLPALGTDCQRQLRLSSLSGLQPFAFRSTEHLLQHRRQTSARHPSRTTGRAKVGERPCF